jgi:hypothetical protein
VDRRKGGHQRAATHNVNKPTRAVRAADLTETRRVSRTIPSILPIALPRLGQYYGEKIGAVCHYVRDVGVAGSNPLPDYLATSVPQPIQDTPAGQEPARAADLFLGPYIGQLCLAQVEFPLDSAPRFIFQPASSIQLIDPLPFGFD